MSLVELTFSALPAHVRTARLVAVATARRAGLDEGLLDEVRLALGEACSRAVSLHAAQAPHLPVRVTFSDDPAGLTVTVSDQGSGPQARPAPGEVSGTLLGSDADGTVGPDVALAVLAGLVEDCSVAHDAGGTTVTLRWPLPPRPLGASGPGSTAAAGV